MSSIPAIFCTWPQWRSNGNKVNLAISIQFNQTFLLIFSSKVSVISNQTRLVFLSNARWDSSRDSSRAKTPVTWGTAIEVPVYNWYWPLGVVLRMLTQGAASSTEWGP